MRNKIFILVFFVLGFVISFFVINNNSKNSENIDPISFSHYVHTKEHKIKCQNCHRGVERQARAEIPNIKICAVCHSRLINPSSEKEKKIYEYVKENKTIPWKVYYNVPDYVYFSHRRHVKLGKLDCTTCHGDMREQTSPELKNFSPVKMQFCFQCHEDKKITTDCGNCHH
jgi:predicted CXXCH cytochrome family protein